ncbi:unnamed protein product [Gadus morhua 'NCC']
MTYEAGRTLTEKRQIWRDAKKFTLKGNCLYYLGENGLSMRRVILTEKEKDEVLTEVHAGHFAVKRMTDKINQRFYWKGITRDTQKQKEAMEDALIVAVCGQSVLYDTTLVS